MDCSSALPIVSPDEGDPTLGLSLNRRSRPGWQLEDCSLLTLSQRCQEDNVAVRKFQRIVMGSELVMINLPEDRCLVFDCLVPRPQFNS